MLGSAYPFSLCCGQARSDSSALAGHGADAIVDAARSNPGALRLVAIGPLTNVALACAKDKELLSKLESLTVMGGDESGEPEFNFASDARAAAEVPPTLHLHTHDAQMSTGTQAAVAGRR